MVASNEIGLNVWTQLRTFQTTGHEGTTIRGTWSYVESITSPKKYFTL